MANSSEAYPHQRFVRVTHWLTSLCFFALLVTGVEILISHPRFYWGETGNVLTPSLFDLPIPASRSAVKTGYNYVLPDQNGWSRSLHFQAAWVVLFTGLVYILAGFLSGHFQSRLKPSLSWRSLSDSILQHLRFSRGHDEEAGSYNVLQRLTYLGVIFGLFPFMIWTGLAMSPAFTAAFPFTVTIFGGHQSARTLHFFATVLLVLFFCVHVFMVLISGFGTRMKAMTIGGSKAPKEAS